jgi:hypothetical protein
LVRQTLELSHANSFANGNLALETVLQGDLQQSDSDLNQNKKRQSFSWRKQSRMDGLHHEEP